MNGSSSPGREGASAPGPCGVCSTLVSRSSPQILSEDLRRFNLASHPRVDDKLDFVALDVTATKTVLELVAEREVTHIVHLRRLAGPVCAADPPLGAMVNVVGTVNMFEAARRAGRPTGLVYASSGGVYGSSVDFERDGVRYLAAPAGEPLWRLQNGERRDGADLRHGPRPGLYRLAALRRVRAGRDQGMTSGPTVAMLAATAGVPYHIRFGGSALLTYAPDCAAAFIASARAARASGDAVCCNVPGRRISMAHLVDLIEDILPDAKGLITYEAAPLRVPALLESPTIEPLVGELPNVPIEEEFGPLSSISGACPQAGVLAPPEPK